MLVDNKKIEYVAFAGSALLLLSVAYLITFEDYAYSLGKLVGDDAGYYLGIARNYAIGYGLSFDRVHATNGFNPLFQAALAGLFSVLPRSAISIPLCYKVGVTLSYLFFVASAVLFFLNCRVITIGSAFLKRRSAAALSAAGVFAYVSFFTYRQIYGHDYTLILLMMNAYMLFLLKRRFNSRWFVADGILLGMLFLTRVDSLVLLFASYCVASYWGMFRAKALMPVLVSVVAAAVVIAPYILWGFMTFGTWLPVSAMLKTTFPSPDLSEGVALYLESGSLGIPGKLSMAGAFVVSLAVLASHARSFFRGPRQWDSVFVVSAVFTLYVVLRVVYLLLFSRFDLQEVYLAYGFPYVLISLLIVFRASKTFASSTNIVATLLVLIGVSFQLYGGAKYVRFVKIYRGDNHQVRFAQAVNSIVSEEEIIFGGANGILGFLADRKWINSDGVVNTYEFARDVLLSSDTVAAAEAYMDRVGVDFMYTHHPELFEGTVVYEQVLEDRGSARAFLLDRRARTPREP